MNMNRFPLFIIVLLFACIANNSNAKDISSYKTGSLSSESANYRSQQASAAISATISGTTSGCLNTPKPKITFTGSGGTAPYTFTYSINGGGDLTVSSVVGNDNVTVDVNTNISGVFVYTLTNVSDSASDTQSLNETATVTVNALPAVDFTYIDNQCNGTGFVFTPSLTGAYSYAWNFGDGATSTDASPTHLFTASGTSPQSYFVKLTITDNSTTCQNTVVKSVMANQLSDATLDGSGSGAVINGVPAFSVCSTGISTFTFKNTSTTLNTNQHYKISWGDGTPDFESATWTTTTHVYGIGLWNLTYTVQGADGCLNVKHYYVFDGSNPGVALGNPGSTNICISQTLTFQISGTENNPNGTTYTISYNDGSPNEVYTHPAPAQVTHKFLKSSCGTSSSDGSTTYQNAFFAKIIAYNLCGTSASTVTPIYVSTPPTADFTLPSNSVCTNNQICFTNSSKNGNAINGGLCSTNSNLIWSITPASGYTLKSGTLGDDFGTADPILWSSGTNAICPVFTKPGTYTITMKIGNRCDIDSITKTICVEAPVVPQFSLSATQGCAPFVVTTTNNTDTSNSCTPTYKWTVKYAANYCGTTSGYTFTSGTSASSLSPAFQFTTPGIYTLQLAVTNSCGTQTISKLVNVTKPPTASINPIPDFCGPTSFNPVAVVNTCAPVSGTFSYAWDFPGGTPANSTTLNPGTITYNTVGNYTVSLVVTNDCGSSATATTTFAIKPVPIITNTALAQTICSGLKTDLVTLTSNLPNVTYSWTAAATPGITGFVPSGTSNTLPVVTILNSTNVAGTVTFSITPSLNGCAGDVVKYVVTVNAAPTITTQPQSVQLCQGGTSIPLSVTVANGLGIPSYQWYQNTVNNNTTGTLLPSETNATYSPLIATVGTSYYYCEIVFSAGGCSTLVSNVAVVSVESIPVIKTQPTPVQAICVGGTTPVPLSVSYTGGAGVASYQWFSNSTNATTGGIPVSGATNLNFTPPVFNTIGTYYYYAEIKFSGSACGSILTDTAKISVVADPVVILQPETTQTLCQNTVPAVLSVDASGGIGVFSYQWYSNSTSNTLTGAQVLNATNNTFIPPTLNVGTTYYYCVISQPNGPGCSVTSNASEVIVKATPIFTKQPVSSTVCFGILPTVLSVTAINGTGAPQYQWYSNTKDSINGGIPISGATSSTYTPPSGAVGTIYYYCIVTYLSGGCSTLTSDIVYVTINAYPVISAYTAEISSGKTFTVSPNTLNGDIVPTGTTYTWTIQAINPVNSITGATSQLTPQTVISQTLTNTTTGIATVTYTVTPTSGSCKGIAFNVTVTVNPPISPNAILTGISCFGANDGSIQTAIQGGVPYKTGNPYIATWTGPNGFTSTDNPIVNLKPGDYVLTIVDSVGIRITNTYTITEPADINIVTAINKNVTCFGAANGEIAITVTGGTKPYTYTWIKDTSPYTGSNDITNLIPGNYTVTVTDKNNCAPKTASFQITEPQAITITLNNQVNVTCFGDSTGAVSVNVAGGVPVQSAPGIFKYAYSWIGPNGFTSSDQNLTGIAAGIYTLTVTDSMGCTQNFVVTITQPDEIKLNPVIIQVTCYGASNASITLHITGGVPPYQIVWSNLGKGTFQDNLSPGTYTIQITDFTGCYMSNDIVIAEAAFSIRPTVKQISCFGAHDGSIILNIQGGIKPITLTWTDNPTAGNIRNQLNPGNYTVTLNDQSSCSIIRTFTIIEPPKLNVSANIIHALDCYVPNSGAINLTITGGTEPYSYLWTNGKTTKNLSGIQGGIYGVTITDANGCSVDTTFEVIRPLPLTPSVKITPNFDCLTHAVKEICTAQATGGIPPYQFTWSNGTTSGLNNEIMETTQPGLVVLGVTDIRGCTASYTFNLLVPVPGIDYQIVNCNAHVLSFKSILPSGIESDYTYSWTFGDGKTETLPNPQHTYTAPGNYTVTLTLVTASCTTVFTSVITVDAAPALTLDKLPVFCTGDSLMVHVSGAESYLWGDGSIGDSLLIKHPGDYSVTGTSKQGCTFTYRFAATNFESYKYTIQSDRNDITTQNPTLQLWSESISYSDYFWNFGDNTSAEGNTQSHTYNIVKDGYYDVKLKVKNPNGCLEYATKRIWITDASMGNVFSPGYDGVYMKGFHIQVYNRNGFLLYDGTAGWDGTFKGTPVTNDTYFYVLYLSGASGIKTKAGYVTVVR